MDDMLLTVMAYDRFVAICQLHNVIVFHFAYFKEEPDLQVLLFGLSLSMYLVMVLGNLLIILVLSSDSYLHTPMYFFLSNLSLFQVDHTGQQWVAPAASIIDGMTEITGRNQYVSICHPLQYPVIMNPRLCVFLVLVSLLFSLLESQIHNLIALYFTYFKDMEISNFFCQPSQVLSLVCFDTFTKNTVMYIVGAIYGFLPVLGIFSSYYKIVSSILRIPSSGGKYKAFSTCGSHLSVVCLFYGTAIGVYLASAVSHSPRKITVFSVMYTVVPAKMSLMSTK
ncbi:olfactory receptor 18-like [Sciurus carolinensis]|uniref:olfactory receptor 18-like n=1 Tax=Sciurus carolinensis TaxID=30640 RepID=UPI001FB3B297|nr:olfactory receptor 18-like [Sciurus carolinensis]